MTDTLARRMSHLQRLEAEAIHIIREVVAAFDNPCMFYSIGKDSTVMLHLARKAFYPGRVPMPLLYVDTTWEFAEMAHFRDRLAAEHQLQILVHTNKEALAAGVHPVCIRCASGGIRLGKVQRPDENRGAEAGAGPLPL
jgi:sulfate adenylyltransferase subunit 2